MRAQIQARPEEVLRIVREIRRFDVASDWKGQTGAPELTTVRRWFDRIWAVVESAVEAVVKQGSAAIDKWTQRIMDEVNAMRAELGDGAEEAIAMLKQKLAEMQQRLCQMAVNLLPSTLTVRGLEVHVSEVTVDYEIQFQTGVEASLTWSLQMAASGSLTVSAKYAWQRGV